MKTLKPVITPKQITEALDYLARYRAHYPLRRPLPTTPGRRRAAILAHGRDTLGALLIDAHRLKDIRALTVAIRAGHDGASTDFEAINTRAAVALDTWED